MNGVCVKSKRILPLGLGQSQSTASTITDSRYQEKQRKKRAKTKREKEEERKWKREAYHKEYGKNIASDDFKKQKEYDSYNEFDIKHIIPKNPGKKLWG